MAATLEVPQGIETKYLPEALALAPSQAGKTVVITGTTSGTGFEAAKHLAKLGATVVVLNRKSERADAALASLREQVPGATFDQVECDLQDQSSVAAAAKAVLSKYPEVDCLCNNAGVMALEDRATKDGYDVQMQTNHLSHFQLTRDLFPALEAAAAARGEARIVNHSSMARLGGDLQAKYFEKNGGKLGGNGSAWTSIFMKGPRWERYHQTKLSNIVFTNALQDRLAAAKSPVKAFTAHPGFAATNLQSTTAQDGGMMTGFFGSLLMKAAQSSEDGAAGIIRCMTDPEAKGGDFFGPARFMGFGGPAVKLPQNKTEESQANKDLLWTKSEEAIGAFQISPRD